MYFKRFLPVFLSVLFLAASVVYVSDKPVPLAVSKKATADSPTVRHRDMRGVWVTYMTLDVEDEADKESAFKTRIDDIIGYMSENSLNTMIVQVRPFCDAIYPSKHFPWSHILTGTQGEDPGYDPLQYIIDRSHESDIAVHAWINPYRIATAQTPPELCENNPYIREPDIGVQVNDGLYLDPASEKARELIVKGVRELAQRYDIDGIQFDDYFYPPDCGDFDKEAYEAYKQNADSPLSLEDFRKDNVSRLIKAVYEAAHKAKPDISFGVSPQGNLKNNDGIYADVAKWCTESGYIDYICPQLYYSLDNPALRFEQALREWQALNMADGISLYIGLPVYKAGTDADDGTWLDNDDILLTEVKICEESGADGFMLYSYDSLFNEESSDEVKNVMNYLTGSPVQ